MKESIKLNITRENQIKNIKKVQIALYTLDKNQDDNMYTNSVCGWKRVIELFKS